MSGNRDRTMTLFFGTLLTCLGFRLDHPRFGLLATASCVLGPAELAEKPGLGHAPIARHGLLRDSEDVGCFFDGEATEEPKFYHTSLPRVHLGKRGQGFIQGFYVNTARLAPQHSFIERDVQPSPAFVRQMLAGMVHENPSDHLRAQGEEVGPVIAADPSGVKQL